MFIPGGSDGKVSAYNAGDPGSIPGLGGSPGRGNSNLLQNSCLRSPMDRGAWQATVHGVTKVRHNRATKEQHRADEATEAPKEACLALGDKANK